MPRIKTSNCVSCLFWFASDAIGILPILIGMKEAKAVPIDRDHSYVPIFHREGGESDEFKRGKEIRMQTKLFPG